VKRAAPGGEGNVLDPFSVEALGRYLLRFDAALAGPGAGPPHAFFYDSFEYYGADWTARMLGEFEARRGYDVRDHVEALFGDESAETVARAKGDYRETLSDLHLAYVRRWTDWAHAHGSLSRNQAHGAPGNLLDLYAAADIPETEVFRGVAEGQMPRLKLASSAAHVSGRPLASAEAFSWLGEHFQVPLSLVKEAADWLLLLGSEPARLPRHPVLPGGGAVAGLAVLRLREPRTGGRSVARHAVARRLPQPSPVGAPLGGARRGRAALLLAPRRLALVR
jgi:hypothetical protein